MRTTVFFNNGTTTTFRSRRADTDRDQVVSLLRDMFRMAPHERGELHLYNRRTSVVLDARDISAVRLG